MQWLPIDSAPKDGSEIDVWVKNQYGLNGYRHTYVKWDDGAWRFYNHVLGRWFKVEVESGAEVTHWMPIAEPPGKTKSAGKARWSPISTAPKDGTHVLLHDPMYGGETFVGYWRGTRNEWCGVGPEGMACRGDGDIQYSGNVTHWMPLPEPPQSDA